MDDAVCQTAQRLGQAGDLVLGKAVLLKNGDALGEVKRMAGEDDLEFDLVVQIGLRHQAVDVVVDEAIRQRAVNVAWNKRVEADTDIDIRQAVETYHQRKTSEVLVTVVVALISPNRVGDELLVKR